jgi:hypothetical protein
MVTAAQIEKQITRELARSFSAQGFVPESAHLLESARGNGVAWQLRCGARMDQVTKKILVGLSAGLRFESVEVILARDQEPRAPTLSVPLHLLHEDRVLVEWDAADSGTGVSLVEEVRRYAIPFFERYERLENVREALESEDLRKSLPVSRNERIELMAAVLAVLGRHAEALDWVNREIEALRNKPPGHRRRLERLREKLQ